MNGERYMLHINYQRLFKHLKTEKSTPALNLKNTTRAGLDNTTKNILKGDIFTVPLKTF